MKDQIQAELTQPSTVQVDFENMTDTDIRQLIIHYATLLRDPQSDRAHQVVEMWDSWPIEFFKKFANIVETSSLARNDFWSRPADINIKYGI